MLRTSTYTFVTTVHCRHFNVHFRTAVSAWETCRSRSVHIRCSWENRPQKLSTDSDESLFAPLKVHVAWWWLTSAVHECKQRRGVVFVVLILGVEILRWVKVWGVSDEWLVLLNLLNVSVAICVVFVRTIQVLKTLCVESLWRLLWRLSLKTVSEDSLWRLSLKSLSEDFLWRLFLKNLSEDSLWRLSVKTLFEDSLWRLLWRLLWKLLSAGRSARLSCQTRIPFGPIKENCREICLQVARTQVGRSFIIENCPPANYTTRTFYLTDVKWPELRPRAPRAVGNGTG